MTGNLRLCNALPDRSSSLSNLIDSKAFSDTCCNMFSDKSMYSTDRDNPANEVSLICQIVFFWAVNFRKPNILENNSCGISDSLFLSKCKWTSFVNSLRLLAVSAVSSFILSEIVSSVLYRLERSSGIL